ncbi:hypothetical protein HaLaN_28478, partial [Haematococcus lacustris]
TDIPVSAADIPNLSCRNLFLQLCRGLPGDGEGTQPSAAVAAVLAAHPDLSARLDAIPRNLAPRCTVQAPSAAAAVALAEQREFVFNPATQNGLGIDPGVTQVHLAAASSADISLEANLKHITVTLATWNAVWEVYLDPKWARQRLWLYGAQDRALEQFFKKLEEDMAELSMKRHGRAKQLVVFVGAASIGTRGGWGADAVLRACCKVVCWPRGKDRRWGRVVIVDEHHTTRVSSAVNGQQACEEQVYHEQPMRPAGWKPPAGQVDHQLLRPTWSQQQPGPSNPPPAKRSKRTEAEQAAEPTQPTKDEGKGKGKAAKAKPAPQPGRPL